ncbi:hypothetical protein LUZ60_013412 [Juncus effusus]|nr:hypothetical protein LUZ60_013412 [Juncus effusus]
MSEDEGEAGRWMCGRNGVVNLHRVSAIVRDMRDPCHSSPSKGHKMLRPEKWQSIFDSDGKVMGFHKALKLIILGGVDPSIRAEVWEFLLGCYALGSTSEYRKHLRTARRERYQHLLNQCQSMHSSIGTGELAYHVGSRVMDVRTASKELTPSPKNDISSRTSQNNNKRKSYRNSNSVQSPLSRNSNLNFENDEGPKYDSDDLYEYPSIPVLWDKGDENETDQDMHSFEISNNIDLIMESKNNDDEEEKRESERWVDKVRDGFGGPVEINDSLRISDAPIGDPFGGPVSVNGGLGSDGDRVSEWLWTLHRIVVDVVRTDSNLEFYEDSRNMARMSDILAVYAWVDPSTGYCQGMSDILSPFVVLYEDNADAFWCFEMLLRRLRDNFQMEGPAGVMRQLESLWKIIEITDFELFEHLSLIGAESLHFAFRMLLVLFRRELSFDESLSMWEMMWAADFDEEINRQLDQNCLEPLNLDLSTTNTNPTDNSRRKPKHKRRAHYKNGQNSGSFRKNATRRNPLCGFPRVKRNFWVAKEENENEIGACGVNISKSGDDELAVFCVGAILIINRQKIMRETRSIDDIIKMFNDNVLKINVKRCVRMAIKLRKKYFYKLVKTSVGSNGDQMAKDHM